ncbi:FAD/NAD(P)-binding protein [Caulobacter sp. S45]|uniref:FAD/NAD(P)-binding protein n=1 Tax=Caulobacter sp. S45 TaxID=1641861 RepID=UPI001575BFE0|nr:FAD/NAD(P)-binding protein [Caulobacter sp. S45]
MPSRLSDELTVAIVGAGFSGLLTALNLLREREGPRVRLIERRSFGRGAAYATRSQEHLLNVRAANMSAFPERPRHFTDWLATQGQVEEDATFVTRARYGGYLQAMLREAAEASEAGRLILESDAAVELRPGGRGWTVTLAMGRSFPADAAVLAVGNLPPHLPPGVDAATAESPAYFGDPWSADFSALPEEGCVVVIGTGLTMVDLALRLTLERPGLTMLALSRRGLQPRRHLAHGPAPEPFAPEPGETPLSLLRRLRAGADVTDWRALIDGLRPHVQAVWRSWSLEARGRFLRHLRPWWDIHRHRLAPAVASKLDHLSGSGALAIAAGRIASVRAEGGGLQVVWTPRGAREPQALAAVGVVNCTGPNGDLTRVADPLLAGLVGQGLVRADACRLGLDVGADGRLIGRDGVSELDLYAVGPITRGAFWEITSVPDIRIQAAQCAAAILERARARLAS